MEILLSGQLCLLLRRGILGERIVERIVERPGETREAFTLRIKRFVATRNLERRKEFAN